MEVKVERRRYRSEMGNRERLLERKKKHFQVEKRNVGDLI